MIFDFFTKLTGSEISASIISALLPLFLFVLPFALIAVLLERKVSAHIQDRLGPMRVGYHGILQTLADILKLIQKEDIIADSNDKPLFNIAPVLVFAGSYAVFAAIPFTSSYIGSNINLGLFYIIGISGIVVIGILMAGWASNNKYTLLGAMRSAAQLISYEIPTLMIVVTILMMIFGGQATGIAKILLIPFMIVGFVVIYISTLAEVNRTPFDISEAESELVSGYHTEYSGMKFAIFFLAEYANMFAVSAIVVVLFFGGYLSPIGYLGNTLGLLWLIPVEQLLWFTFKGVAFVLVQMWLRWTLPRLRVDQLMAICWKYLIPIAFVNLLIVGLITLI